MIDYIYDFLSLLFSKIDEKRKIKNIVLFGSFARGNPRKDSDIDLFIDVSEENKGYIENNVREAIEEFRIKAEDSWHLKGINNDISAITDNLENEKWIELKKEISLYGIILYGRFFETGKTKKQKVLIEYNLSKLPQKIKMKVIRGLSGYKQKKGKKVYNLGGEHGRLAIAKIGSAILVDVKNYKEIVDFLRENKAGIRIFDL